MRKYTYPHINQIERRHYVPYSRDPEVSPSHESSDPLLEQREMTFQALLQLFIEDDQVI